MSLINDALKKAQRDRAHPAAPQSPAASGPATAAPAALRAPRRSLWPFALVVLALLGGGTAVWFLKPANTATATTAPAEVAAARLEAPPPPAQEPEGPAQTPAAEPQLQIHLPSATQPPAAAVPAQATAPIPAPVTSAPAAPPAPAAVAPAPAPSGPEPLKITLQMEDPRILAFLDSARINGVRSTADDAKLLMNNKVFRVGGVVDRELGLKLVQIRPGELVFEDTHGIQYRKTL